MPLSTIDLHYVGFQPHLPFILIRFTELILEGSYSEFSVVRMKQRLRLRGKIQGAASPPLLPVICFVMQLRIPLLCQNPFACCSTLSQWDSSSECIAPRFCPSFPPSMTDCTSKWEEEPYQADCVAWIVHTVRSRIIYSPTSSVANLLQLSWSQGMGVLFYIDICGIHIVLLFFLPWYVAGCSCARVARHHQGALFCLVIKQQLCLLSTRQQQSRVGCSWWNFWQYAKYRSCQP